MLYQFDLVALMKEYGLWQCPYIPTKPFKTLELQNPMNNVLELHKIGRSLDFEALQLRKGRSELTAIDAFVIGRFKYLLPEYKSHDQTLCWCAVNKNVDWCLENLEKDLPT